MFHWDLPQALEDRGGWRVRATAEAFGRYADTIVHAYGDRVKNWITLNEMCCFTALAYGDTIRPPGVVESAAVVNQTYHHALLAHGHGVPAVREHGGRGARVGLTDDSTVTVPATETEPDIVAARQAFTELNIRSIDPIFRGGYSETYFRLTGRNRAKSAPGDFALIARPTDFFGFNIDSGVFVRAGRGGAAGAAPVSARVPRTGELLVAAAAAAGDVLGSTIRDRALSARRDLHHGKWRRLRRRTARTRNQFRLVNTRVVRTNNPAVPSPTNSANFIRQRYYLDNSEGLPFAWNLDTFAAAGIQARYLRHGFSSSGAKGLGVQLSDVGTNFDGRVTTIVGLRRDASDRFSVSSTNDATTGEIIKTRRDFDDSATTPSAGLVVYPIPQFGPFFNYSESYVPPGLNDPLILSRDQPGAVIGSTREYGFYFKLFENRIQGSARRYNALQSGRIVNEFLGPADCRQRAGPALQLYLCPRLPPVYRPHQLRGQGRQVPLPAAAECQQPARPAPPDLHQRRTLHGIRHESRGDG